MVGLVTITESFAHPGQNAQSTLVIGVRAWHDAEAPHGPTLRSPTAPAADDAPETPPEHPARTPP